MSSKAIELSASANALSTFSIIDSDTQKVLDQLCVKLSGVAQPALLLFFCSDSVDLSLLDATLQNQFSEWMVIGGVAPGLIGEGGYLSLVGEACGLVGVLFSDQLAQVELHALDDLSMFELSQGFKLGSEIKTRLTSGVLPCNAAGKAYQYHFGILSICSSHKQQEKIIESMQVGLNPIPLLGAIFERKIQSHQLYVEDGFRSESAMLAIIRLTQPIHCFSAHAYRPNLEEAFVVTQSDVDKHLVLELDGVPAAQALAWKLDCSVDKLQTQRHKSAFCTQVGEMTFPRSISAFRPDFGLEMNCALEEGSILYTANHLDPVDCFYELLAEIKERIGEHYAIIGFDNMNRRLVAEELPHRLKALNRALNLGGVIGCNSRSEHFKGSIRNFSLTGVAMALPSQPGGVVV